MNCEEVKISLNHYVDNSIDDFKKREIETHIRNCDLCFREYKKLTHFFDRLKELPLIIKPSNEILAKVKDALLKDEGEKVSDEKPISKAEAKKLAKEKKNQEKILTKRSTILNKSKMTRKTIKRTALIVEPTFNLKKTLSVLIPVLLLAAGYFLYDLSKYNSPWKIISIDGIIFVNGMPMVNNDLNQSSSLFSDLNSKAKLAVPKVGIIELSGNTLIVLEKAKDGDNEVAVKKGKVRVVNSKSNPDLTLTVNKTEFVNKGGEFELDVSELRITNLKVETGYIDIVQNEKHYLVNHKNTCVIKPGLRPGLPVHFDATLAFKNAVDLFDYSNGGEHAVESIINNAKQTDMLTLLALIPYVSSLQRQILFQEISNRFPPPETVTMAGVIRLDEDMLRKWWEEIEWQI